jgi:primosomal protein N''
MSIVHKRILESLKEITPMAQAADEILESLSLENKGRFASIFPKHSLFSTEAKRFLPYLEEVDIDLKNLPTDMQDPAFEPLLTDLMKKIEVLFQVLASFHEIRDDENS